MKELYIFCEGTTEQNFCAQVLRPHLFPTGNGTIHTIKIAHSRRHGITYRGGVSRYSVLKTDLVNTLKSRRQPEVRFSSLIDLYALPSDFPGKSAMVRNASNPHAYVSALEQSFAEDIQDHRFIPHLQLYEFETMLYANPEGFRIAFDNCDSAITSLNQIIAAVPSIEHINDDPSTAPSKRIISCLPEFAGRKSSAGPDIAEYIGIEMIRSRCIHFSEWLSKLESLWPT